MLSWDYSVGAGEGNRTLMISLEGCARHGLVLALRRSVGAGDCPRVAQDRSAILDAMNQAVSRLHVYEDQDQAPGGDEDAA